MDEQTPKPHKRWWRIVLCVCGIALLAIAGLPTLVAKTSLRNALVNRALDDPRLEASVGSASFGWMSSASLDQLRVERDDQKLLVTIDRVLVERSLLGLLFALPDVGHIEIAQPHLGLTLQPHERDVPVEEVAAEVSKRSRPETTFSAAVRDASIVVRAADVEEPVVDVADVTMILRLQQAEVGREFVIEPGIVLNHQKLTPLLCDRGLHLVAPVLADAATVEGEVSVEIDEFHVPVDRSAAAPAEDNTRISGNVVLHHVRSNLKNPILIETTKLIAGLLKTAPPETIRVLENSRIQFRVADQGVYHEGLAFVLPDVSEELQIRSSGFVGVDRRLDLKVEVALPSKLTTNIPVLSKLTSRPLNLVVQGTLDQPKVRLASGQDVLDELAGRLDGSEQPLEPAQPLAKSIIDLVGGLSENPGEGVQQIDVESTTKGIINLIRSSRDKKKQNGEQSKTREQKRKERRERRNKKRNKDQPAATTP